MTYVREPIAHRPLESIVGAPFLPMHCGLLGRLEFPAGLRRLGPRPEADGDRGEQGR